MTNIIIGIIFVGLVVWAWKSSGLKKWIVGPTTIDGSANTATPTITTTPEQDAARAIQQMRDNGSK